MGKLEMIVTLCYLGRTHYADAWNLQRRIFKLQLDGHFEDVFLLTEHNHVYTIGKGGDENHLLASENELRINGIVVFRIDRGGDITYHGPGQIVGYPLLNLNDHTPDVHLYLRNLEEMMIHTLNEYRLTAGREEGMTGVWVNGEKIAAIGVKVSRWRTMHGFAFNVNTDLTKFDRIIPCGIFHKGVTSLQRILGNAIPLEEVQDKLVNSFSNVFKCEIKAISPVELEDRLQRLEREIEAGQRIE
ncbi:MAG: lipoyl(octanoyl) transferase LipB [bacterium]